MVPHGTGRNQIRDLLFTINAIHVMMTRRATTITSQALQCYEMFFNKFVSWNYLGDWSKDQIKQYIERIFENDLENDLVNFEKRSNIIFYLYLKVKI